MDSHYVHSPSSGVYRNLLLGAQAGVFARGNAYAKADQGKYGTKNMVNWYEDADDYGEEKGIAVGMTFGVKKNTFNSADYGTMVMSSYGAAKRS